VPALSDGFTSFTDMPPVFATAFMVGFIEWACIELLRSALPPEFKTVGTHVDVNHVAKPSVIVFCSGSAERHGTDHTARELAENQSFASVYTDLFRSLAKIRRMRWLSSVWPRHKADSAEGPALQDDDD
jgi:hypothetical protein